MITQEESVYKHFVVTGRLYNSNKRFSNIYVLFKDANMINLWNGSVWGVLQNDKRQLLKRVNN